MALVITPIHGALPGLSAGRHKGEKSSPRASAPVEEVRRYGFWAVASDKESKGGFTPAKALRFVKTERIPNQLDANRKSADPKILPQSRQTYRISQIRLSHRI